MVSGIYWVGRLFERGAWGDVTRNHILGLTQIGFPVRVCPVGSIDIEVRKQVWHYIKPLLTRDVGPNPVVIIDKGLDFIHRVRVANMVKIGRALFETDRIPPSMVTDSYLYDEVWVPSKFNLETFSRSGVPRAKLRVIPYGVDTEVYKPRHGQYAIPDRRKCLFLAIFGFSWKKGFDLLLEAYLKEFTAKDDVTLVMKVLTGSHRTAAGQKAKDLILGSVADRFDLTQKDRPHFVIIDEMLERERLIDLYASCDLYISTDRANGWGMSFMEAMAMGKPAATINYSGSTEFMNRENSLLIETTGRLVPVDPRFLAEAPLFAGHQWGEVRVEEVQRVMRYAYDHPMELKRIAERGMKDIREYYSLEAVARKVVIALAEIVPSQNHRLRRPRITFKRGYKINYSLRLAFLRFKYWWRTLKVRHGY